MSVAEASGVNSAGVSTSEATGWQRHGRAVLRETAFFAIFSAAAVILTWPLARNIGTAVSDLGDPLLNTWILDWVCHSLLHAPLRIFDAPIFYPAKYPLAYSENLIGIGIVMLPLYLAGLKPLVLYNLASLLGFAHAAYGASVLARVMTRSLPAALVSGLFFGFVSFKFDHLAHIQVIWSGWLPLLLAALLVYWRRPSLGRAAALSGAFVMNGLTNIHWLLFGSFALAATIVMFAAFWPVRDRRFWIQLLGALAIGSATLIPILIPYRIVAKEYKMRRWPEEVRWGSATWDDWLRATSRSLVYRGFQDREQAKAERQLFPGLFPLFLTGAALLIGRRVVREEPMQCLDEASVGWRRALRAVDVSIVAMLALAWLGAVTRKQIISVGHARLLSLDSSDVPMMLAVVLILARWSIRFPSAFGGDSGRSFRSVVRASRLPREAWAALLWTGLGILGSLGLNSFFHTFLYRRVDAFQSLRIPARWAVITYTGLAAMSALGVVALLERRRRWSRPAVGLLLVLIGFVEVMPRIRWEQAITEVAPVYRWINYERLGPVLELPMTNGMGVEYQYMLAATAHHVPIMNGTSGFDPPVYSGLRERTVNGKMDATFTAALARSGCRIVIVHLDQLRDQTPKTLDWLRSETSATHLAFLRRFDHGIGGDYVFAVKSNLADWTRYFDTARDHAGFTGTESFDRMLDAKPTYNSETFGRTDIPRPYSEVTGPMTVGGWALSPNGIRKVDVLLHSGRYRLPAELYARPDVAAMYPWYSSVMTPGFNYVFKKRPKGLPRETDIQIEVTDGAGHVTRLPDVLVQWD